jgi:hypothetical protein
MSKKNLLYATATMRGIFTTDPITIATSYEVPFDSVLSSIDWSCGLTNADDAMAVTCLAWLTRNGGSANPYEDSQVLSTCLVAGVAPTQASAVLGGVQANKFCPVNISARSGEIFYLAGISSAEATFIAYVSLIFHTR